MFGGAAEPEPAKSSSRVLKPPGGGTSNLFGSPEEVSSSCRTHRMASNIFGEHEDSQNFPKRTNPPGGKESGIFEDGKPSPSRHLTNPPGGKTSNIFGTPQPTTIAKAHPNKPKDHIILKDGGDARQEFRPKASEGQRPQVDAGSEKRAQEKETIPKDPGPKVDSHEPRLGPRPRSHNKVLNPPGEEGQKRDLQLWLAKNNQLSATRAAYTLSSEIVKKSVLESISSLRG